MTSVRHLLLLCLIPLFSNLQATHLVSMDGYAECTKTNGNEKEYTLHISFLRDAVTSTVPFDQIIEFGIYGKTDGLLKKIFEIPINRETPVYQNSQGNNYLKEGYYSDTVTLPNLPGGYVLQFRRCCVPVTDNFVLDVGMELLIFIPDSMQAGQHTLKRNSYFSPLFQKNKTYTFTYPWSHNLYDSIRFESKDYFKGGSDTDPMPSPSSKLNYGNKGFFRNGASAGNPFGTAGTLTKNTDSTYQILLTQSGRYLYPLSTTCYLNGDSFMQTVLIPAIVVDTIIPLLKLELKAITVDRVELSSFIDGWSSTSSISLHRSEKSNPGTVTTLKSNLLEGVPEQHFDYQIDPGTSYKYYIKLVSAGKSYSSDTLSVNTWNVSLPSIPAADKIQVYPNPAQNHIRINTNTEGTYHLYTMNGQLIQCGELQIGENMIRFGDLKDGIYFLRSNGKSAKVVVRNE